MQTYRIDGDKKHLYFKNIERRSDKEEFSEVMKILHENEAIILDRLVGPDCTLYTCKIKEYRFAVCDASIDGDGTFLCVDDLITMEYLEDIFNDKKIDWLSRNIYERY